MAARVTFTYDRACWLYRNHTLFVDEGEEIENVRMRVFQYFQSSFIEGTKVRELQLMQGGEFVTTTTHLHKCMQFNLNFQVTFKKPKQD